MKKLAIFFLLTTMIAAFSFGQSVTADFSFGNVGEANSGKMDPVLALKFAAGGSKELGPGNLLFSGELQYKVSFQDATGSAYSTGDNSFVVGYGLGAGPGTLTISVKWDGGWGGLTPAVDYDGIEAGPAKIGFGVWYKFATKGTNSSGKKAMFGDEKPKAVDEFGARVSASFDFGLNVTYKFKYNIGDDSEVGTIAYLDANFAIAAVEGLVVGVELDETGKAFAGTETEVVSGITVKSGFMLKPYVNYAVNENLGAGVYCKIQGIGGDGDVYLTPGVWVTYTL